jgi:hypothetical protein
MFTDNPNIEQIAPKIWIYKNFINGELLEKIENIVKYKNGGAKSIDHNLEWYNSRSTDTIPELLDVWEMASELIYPELVMHPQSYLLVSRPDQEGMFIHSDAPGEPHEGCGPVCGTCDIESSKLISEDRWNTCCRLHYGLVIYFGEFEGGEIFYPHVNSEGSWVGASKPIEEGNELRIKPGRGDLVIHGAHNDYAHGVDAVSSGIRYAFSNFVLPASSNPGTFYNYKSDEYNAQIERAKETKSLKEWMTPINGFKWENPEDVQKEREEGITGLRYR